MSFDMYETGKIPFAFILILPCIGYFLMSPNDSDPAPCGACGSEVTDTGILCDTCSQWYHPNCENMGNDSYNFHIMNPDFSWVCQTCGAPNHSVLSLGNNLASFESHNSFSSLSDSASRNFLLSTQPSVTKAFAMQP